MPDGTDGRDALEGTKGADVINALGGNDDIFGSDGHDTVDGGPGGADRLWFDFGKSGILTTSPSATQYVLTSSHFSDNAGLIDTSFVNVERFRFTRSDSTSITFDGSAWNNGGSVGGLVLELGPGNDNVIGSPLNDSIVVGGGINFVDGGAGTDQVRHYIDSSAGKVTVSFNGSSGTAVQNGISLLTVTNVEQMAVGYFKGTPSGGGPLQVDASGSPAGVIFMDSNGDDIFTGSAFNDYFATIDGLGQSGGNDVFYGGAGNDTWDFITSIQGLDGTTIMDFAEGDVIDLSLNDGVTGASKIKVDTFIGTAAFSGVAGEVRYAFDSGATLLMFDSNGDKVADGTLRIANGQFQLESFASPADAITLGIRIKAGSAPVNSLIEGTPGNDTLKGTVFNDIINGLGGRDEIYGSDGKDTIDGGPGNDRLWFDYSVNGDVLGLPDRLEVYVLTSSRFYTEREDWVDTSFTNIERFRFTRTDDYRVFFDARTWGTGTTFGVVVELGSADAHDVRGSPLDDIITLGGTQGFVDGEAGNDQVRLTVASGAKPVILQFDGSSGTAMQDGTMLLSTVNVEIFGAGNFSGTYTGSGFYIDASSSTGRVLFMDSTGDDTFTGGSGDDIFATVDGLGNSGGNDVLFGGPGNDIYDFIGSIQGLDHTTIMDFEQGDYIDLSLNNGVGGATKIKVDTFIGSAPFSGAPGEVRYGFDHGSTLLMFDSNGDKVADGTLRIANGQFALESFASAADGVTLGIRIVPGSFAGNNLTGGSGSDTLTGGNGPDTLTGGDGNDVLIGGGGADQLIGGAGIDTVSYAGDGGAVFVNLTLGRGYTNTSYGDTYDSIENVIGTDFNDFLIGDPNVNRLDGGAGDDTIVGAVGPDEIIGGAGTDLLSFEDNSGTVFVNLLTAKGYNNAAQGDTFSGIENVIGGLFDDTLIGDDGPNRLDGAMGADTLVGNGGADTFVFRYAPGAASGFEHPNSSANVDTIFDFVSGQDKLEINAATFGGGLVAGPLAAAAFVLGTAAGDADDRFIYDQANGKLYYDADGNGAGAQLLMLLLPNHDAVAASDFVIV